MRPDRQAREHEHGRLRLLAVRGEKCPASGDARSTRTGQQRRTGVVHRQLRRSSEQMHPHDVGQVLDSRRRSPSAVGHHCATAGAPTGTGSAVQRAGPVVLPLHQRRPTMDAFVAEALGTVHDRTSSGGTDGLDPWRASTQQVILDHAREKHRPAACARAGSATFRSGESRQYNPLLRRRGDAAGLGFRCHRQHRRPWWSTTCPGTVEGCSISAGRDVRAVRTWWSARPVDEATEHLHADYLTMMLRSLGEVGAGRGPCSEDADGVRRASAEVHANRVKCAILGWTAFEDAALMLER